MHHLRPKIVLVRHRLSDGYSDDVLAALGGAGLLSAKVVVLIAAGTSAGVEARQIVLGADCVQRDPVRPDVLVEYLAKYHQAPNREPSASPKIVRKPFAFAGATADPVGRILQRGKKTCHLTPHEVDLAELLVQSEGGVLTYETLYHDLLGRRFRGDTSNMRVLLGKLGASALSVGVKIRSWVEVIPKMGYRYRPPQPKDA
ncbi:MAG: winged helix-turn-helix domain-containing protein [Opitutaceae bacterium]